MKVLLLHNHYRERGVEDSVFASEGALLESRGHLVSRYTRHNEEATHLGTLSLASKTLWSRQSYNALRQLIRQLRPDVMHVHNTLPLLSPSVYWAAHAERVPVVQTLHNYRLLCPNALFFRDGHPCEKCLGRLPWPGVLHACYRHSHAASAVLAVMLALHRTIKTWQDKVDTYIALTEFAKRKFIQGGLPPQKVIVKPNCVHPDPGMGQGQGGNALFVGRLSPEKGIRALLDGWKSLNTAVRLTIVGDGPGSTQIQKSIEARGIQNVEVLGRRPRDQVLRLMRDARFLVFPSECYESFPMSIAEAFACGTPVVAARVGAMVEVVEDGRTGLHFNPGDAADLAAKMEWLLTHPKDLVQMRKEARAEYEAKYTAERNYSMLIEIYAETIRRRMMCT